MWSLFHGRLAQRFRRRVRQLVLPAWSLAPRCRFPYRIALPWPANRQQTSPHSMTFSGQAFLAVLLDALLAARRPLHVALRGQPQMCQAFATMTIQPVLVASFAVVAALHGVPAWFDLPAVQRVNQPARRQSSSRRAPVLRIYAPHFARRQARHLF